MNEDRVLIEIHDDKNGNFTFITSRGVAEGFREKWLVSDAGKETIKGTVDHRDANALELTVDLGIVTAIFIQSINQF